MSEYDLTAKGNYKKNCNNCKHFASDSDGEYGEWPYNYCSKRDSNGEENEKNFDQMQKKEYLSKGKSCCEFTVTYCTKCKAEGLDHHYLGEKEGEVLCYECFDYSYL